MISINSLNGSSSIQTNLLGPSPAKSMDPSNTDSSVTASNENQSSSQNGYAYSLSHILSLQFENNINDTTNAILKNLKDQMEGNLANLDAPNQTDVNAMSIQVGQEIAQQGAQGLVQNNKNFIQNLQDM